MRLFMICSIFVGSNVLAHPGHGSSHVESAFLAGFFHPLTGLDHLAMLVGLGILIGYFTSLKSSAGIHKWALSMFALVALTLGLIAGAFFGAFSAIEFAIGASIFMVALAIWAIFSVSKTKASMLVFSSIALVFFHGFAHGVEATGNLAGFGLGMLVAATILIALGQWLAHFFVTKWVAAGVAVSGLALMNVF